METILVTGSNGFIGREIVKQLTNRYKLILINRKKSESDPTSFLLDFDQITKEFLNSNKVTRVIHCAWEDLNDFDSGSHLENLEKHKKFFQTVSESEVVEIIGLGTCLEYGKVDGELFESMTAKPITKYAAAKLELFESSKSIFLSCNKVFKWFRIFYVYGENQKASSLFPSLLKLKHTDTKVLNMSLGTQIRDFIRVEDVADSIVKLIGHPYSGIINCSSSSPISVYDFVLKTLKEFGLENQVQINRGEMNIPYYEGFSFWGNNFLLRRLLDE